MAEKEVIIRLKKEFSFLKKWRILAILLFGSHAKKEIGPRDIDICIVAPQMRSKEVLRGIYKKIDVHGKHYDIYCFEELPLYLKWEIITHHKVIYAKNEGDLYEYLYYFRKLEQEQRHRQEINKEEIFGLLHAKAGRYETFIKIE